MAIHAQQASVTICSSQSSSLNPFFISANTNMKISVGSKTIAFGVVRVRFHCYRVVIQGSHDKSCCLNRGSCVHCYSLVYFMSNKPNFKVETSCLSDMRSPYSFWSGGKYNGRGRMHPAHNYNFLAVILLLCIKCCYGSILKTLESRQRPKSYLCSPTRQTFPSTCSPVGDSKFFIGWSVLFSCTFFFANFRVTVCNL